MTTVPAPEMSELYRRLLEKLTATFGGKLDDANAEAIAYAAAELYHRDFEPRLWQEKSTHDLLDLFGVPRAGVFAPYSLSDRVLIFQRRSNQSEYVNRAHELLTAVGVPRQDVTGRDRPLKWRLEIFLAPVEQQSADEQDGPAEGVAEVEDVAEAEGAKEESRPEEVPGTAKEDGAEAEATAPRTGRPGVIDPLITEHPELDEPDGEPAQSQAEEAEEAAAADETGGAEAEEDVDEAQHEAGEAGGEGEAEEETQVEEETEEAEAEEETQDEAEEEAGEAAERAEDGAEIAGNGTALAAEEADETDETDDGALVEDPGAALLAEDDELDIDVEPGAAPLVDAVRALEHAARVEAELAQAVPTWPAGAAGVDLAKLTTTLDGIQAQMAALHALVEALGIEVRERLDILHEEILVSMGKLGPETSPALMGAADEVTRELPPVPADVAPVEDAETERVNGVARRAGRRVLLIVLLVLLGMLVAGTILAAVVYGWDQVRSQISGALSLR